MRNRIEKVAFSNLAAGGEFCKRNSPPASRDDLYK